MVSVLILLSIAGAVGALLWFGYHLKKKRRDALAAFARHYGLDFAPEDPFGLVHNGFQLFSLGEGRGCENVVWGRWQDMPVKGADYFYYTESTDSEGHTSRSYHHFSVVLADMEASVPPLSVHKENLLTRLADHLGFRDVEFESEEFNRRFQVKARDREFAFSLIDARMIRWLLFTGGEFGFEVQGSSLLAYSRRRKPNELVPLFGAAKGFRDHIPRLVWTRYGTGVQPR